LGSIFIAAISHYYLLILANIHLQDIIKTYHIHTNYEIMAALNAALTGMIK